ncbi:hypothetical protein [Maritimibacter sp. DP1N21-5]|uniref:hypothetical protein n=1 Tax=Maritimibacter sp. DP1N21-5 TaxID=2836867 RepID=UPI001C45D27B|nr:hypothetical protein [Maritimibacter sp. DP1N21-5]MBV7410328.1 hypothetical protein [Maritimibacter sp. DP1N21-5]
MSTSSTEDKHSSHFQQLWERFGIATTFITSAIAVGLAIWTGALQMKQSRIEALADEVDVSFRDGTLVFSAYGDLAPRLEKLSILPIFVRHSTYQTVRGNEYSLPTDAPSRQDGNDSLVLSNVMKLACTPIENLKLCDDPSLSLTLMEVRFSVSGVDDMEAVELRN